MLNHVEFFSLNHIDGSSFLTILEAFLSKHIFDKLHDLHTEAVGLDPKFELRVLCLDLLDEAVERKVDFVAQILKLLGTQVRVVVDHAFHL